MHYLRSPRRIELLWPFFGAPLETLEALSSGFAIQSVDEDVRLCDREQVPSDPCSSLYVLVQGTLAAVSSDTDGNQWTETMGRGNVFGARPYALVPRSWLFRERGRARPAGNT